MLESATWKESIGPYEVQMRATTAVVTASSPAAAAAGHIGGKGHVSFYHLLNFVLSRLGSVGQDPRTACKIVVAF